MIEPGEKSRTPKLKKLLKQLADHSPSIRMTILI